MEAKYGIIIVILYIWCMDIKFEVRNTNIDDYKELCDWWKFWKFKAPPLFILPDDKSDGLMVSYKGENLCAGFIYSTSSSSLFHVEWIVSTYKIKDKLVRKEGLNFLINGLGYMGKQMGAKVIYTSLVNPMLIKRYADCGWNEGSKNATEMVMVVK